ncbi:MAG: hypothetical protein ABSH53_02680 [Holophaga sp.]|jgi:hypothetical protein
MSQPNPTPAYPKWLSVSIVVLLTAQVALLWTHGSMLQRQHEDIQDLREDLQSLAEDLYQDQDGWDSNEEDPNPQPTAMVRHHRPGRSVRAAWMQGQGQQPASGEGEDAQEQAAKKDLDAARQSGQEAVAKAHKVQEQLSLTENARKAEEKAKIMAEGESWRIWMWVGACLAAAALMLRLRLRRGA